jgi:pimeloyl-ACP methyl ester carboxylesterase
MFLVKKFNFLKKFPLIKDIKVGSKDYRKTSGLMRETFRKIIEEDIREITHRIKIPTLLIYGGKDTAVPIYMGEEYNKNIKNSTLCVIPEANHYDLIIGKAKLSQHYIIKFIREKL